MLFAHNPRMMVTWQVLEAAKDAGDQLVIAACRRIITADRVGWRKHGNRDHAMAITNPRHVPHGIVRLTLADGTRCGAVQVMHNDVANEVLWVERDEGVFWPVPYSEFNRATVPLNR